MSNPIAGLHDEGPCEGQATLVVAAGPDTRLPVLLIPAQPLGPAKSVDTDLVRWLSKALPELARYLPD